jgi:hypothetical protein
MLFELKISAHWNMNTEKIIAWNNTVAEHRSNRNHITTNVKIEVSCLQRSLKANKSEEWVREWKILFFILSCALAEKNRGKYLLYIFYSLSHFLTHCKKTSKKKMVALITFPPTHTYTQDSLSHPPTVRMFIYGVCWCKCLYFLPTLSFSPSYIPLNVSPSGIIYSSSIIQKEHVREIEIKK